MGSFFLTGFTGCGALGLKYSPKDAKGTEDLSIYETSIVADSENLTLSWSLNSNTIQRMRLMGCPGIEVPAKDNQTGTQEEANCRTILILNCTETNDCEKEENNMPYDFHWEWKKSTTQDYVDYKLESRENPGIWKLLADPAVLNLHPWNGFWIRVESRDESAVGKWVRVDSN